MRRKTTVCLFQMINQQNITREDLDMAMEGKSYKRN